MDKKLYSRIIFFLKMSSHLMDFGLTAGEPHGTELEPLDEGDSCVAQSVGGRWQSHQDLSRCMN